MHLVSGQVRSTRWAGIALVVLGLMVGLGGVSGCVTTVGQTVTRNAGDKDLAVTGDPVDLDRRAKIRMELAAAYFGRGQSKDALDEIRQALAARPDNANAYGLRGLVYAQMGDADNAEQSFRRALQLAPRDGDVMHNYGWFLCQQKRYPEADAQFVQALAQPAYRATGRTLLAQGVCQARAGNLPEAERTLSHAYELDPSSPATAVNLAEVLYRHGDYVRARFYIRRVNNKDDQVSAQTLWLGAKIERKLGQDAQAQEMGEQLQKRFPQAPETLLFEKGRFDE